MQNYRIYFTGKNQAEFICEDLPPLLPNEVHIRATKSLISSGTESICFGRLFDSGTHWDNWVKYPFSPGYSLVGQIEEVGAEVDGFKVGDRVAIRERHRQCLNITTDRLYPIPDAVSDEDATWFALATIAQNGVRRAEHVMGDAVVVVGLGLLGQLVTQYARLMGARQIIVIDPAAMRLEMARQHGATTAQGFRVEEAREEVYRLTDGMGAELVYDITGIAAVFSQALGLLRKNGRLLLLGDTGSPASQTLTSDVLLKGAKIIGAHEINAPYVATEHCYWSHQNMAQLFYSYVARKDMIVSDLVTHRYHPKDAQDAFIMLQTERSTAMGVIFDWTQV